MGSVLRNECHFSLWPSHIWWVMWCFTDTIRTYFPFFLIICFVYLLVHLVNSAFDVSWTDTNFNFDIFCGIIWLWNVLHLVCCVPVIKDFFWKTFMLYLLVGENNPSITPHALSPFPVKPILLIDQPTLHWV